VPFLATLPLLLPGGMDADGNGEGSMMTDREDDGWSILSVGFGGSGFKSRTAGGAGGRGRGGGCIASRTNLGVGRQPMQPGQVGVGVPVGPLLPLAIWYGSAD
jgi:hypothetical protein